MGRPVFFLCSLTWGQTDGGNEDNGDLLQKVPCTHYCTQWLDPEAGHCQPMSLLETPGHSWSCLGQFLVGSLLLSPGSWCTQGFVCSLQESVSPVLCKFWWFYGRVNGDLLQEGLCHTQVCCSQSPCPCGRSLLTLIFTRDPQTQSWLSLCGLGVHSVPFPGLSSWVDQVLGEHTVPGGLCILITSLVQASQFPECVMRAASQVHCMSLLESWSQTVTRLADVNHPGSQEDLVSSWEPAHSLAEGAISVAEIAAASCLLALAVGSLPLCLQAGRGRYAALLWYLLNPLFCEWVRAYRGKVLFPQLGVYSVGLFSCLCVFLFYVAFWTSETPHRPACERVSYCVETSSQLPPQERSPSLTFCVSFCLLYFSYLLLHVNDNWRVLL